MDENLTTRQKLMFFVVELEKLRDEFTTQILVRQRLELRRLEYQRQQANIEANITLNISMAVDNQGKPIYTNESIRKANILLKVKGNTEHLTLRKQCSHLDKRILRLRAEEDITNTQIKKCESLQRVYFIDLENK